MTFRKLHNPTDRVKVIEAKLRRKYRRERLRRSDELLSRYRAGSSQHKELEQIRHSIRADIKRDRRDREMQSSRDASSIDASSSDTVSFLCYRFSISPV